MRKFVIPLMLAMMVIWFSQADARSSSAPLSTAELKKTIGAEQKATLIFFQNPLGGPCKIQNEIIQKLLKDRRNGFNVAAVSTMKSEDQKAFYDYGVRSLPTVVIVDKKGHIINYFPPGIQSYETLSAALSAVK